MLIAVEGIDGTGKTTISKFIFEFLSKKGFECILLREPGDSIYGKKIRNSRKRISPEEEIELFMRDREEDVKKNILPALKEGKIVIMDRYYYSTIAYQGARGIDTEKIKEMNERIAPKPDLVILLDADPEKVIKRIEARGELTPFEDIHYLRRVREIFLNYVDEKVVIVDASKPLEKVKEEVKKALCLNLKKNFN